MITNHPNGASRQRRKEASCDECRKRKIKCNATQESSCTECSRRSLPCKFENDPSGKAALEKRIQKLQEQLMGVKQLQLSTAQSLGGTTPTSPPVRVPLSYFARSAAQRPKHSEVEFPLLPTRAVAEQYLDSYFKYIHQQFPVLHRENFQEQIARAYNNPTSEDVALEQMAVFFAVLACGALLTGDSSRLQEAQRYSNTAVSTLDHLKNELSIEHAIVAFLTSVFLAELNQKPAGWIQLGIAMRIAQVRGLHIERDTCSPVEGEMRKQIWHSFCVWDR